MSSNILPNLFSLIKKYNLSKEEENLIKIAFDEYHDLFPNILNIHKRDFIPTLLKFIQISLIPKNLIYNEQTIKKILKIIEEDLYETEFTFINDKIHNLKNINCERFTGKNFIPHCNKTSIPLHNCGHHLYSLDNGLYFLCLNCKQIYHPNSIILKCDNCDLDYYSKIEKNYDPENNFHPATWLKYHCNAVINDIMKCPNCKDNLYINSKNKNILICKKCKSEFDQLNIKWKCIICNNDFSSEAKIYNPLEFKIMKMAVKNTLFNGIEAKPEYVPCCNIKKEDIVNYKFCHKKECNGVIYQGKFNKRKIVVCSKCHMLNYYEYHFWMCPICHERFQINKNMKSRINSNNRKNNNNHQFNNGLNRTKTELNENYEVNSPRKKKNINYNINSPNDSSFNIIQFNLKKNNNDTHNSNNSLNSNTITTATNSYNSNNKDIMQYSPSRLRNKVKNIEIEVSNNYKTDGKKLKHKTIANGDEVVEKIDFLTESNGPYNKKINNEIRRVLSEKSKIGINYYVSPGKRRFNLNNNIKKNNYNNKIFSDDDEYINMKVNVSLNKNYTNLDLSNPNTKSTTILNQYCHRNSEQILNSNENDMNVGKKNSLFFSQDFFNKNRIKNFSQNKNSQDQIINNQNYNNLSKDFSLNKNKNKFEYYVNNLSKKQNHIKNIQINKIVENIEENNNKNVTEKSQESDNIEINTFKSDDYNIIRQIGEGTFGKIYEVEDSNHKKFAMKKLIASSEEEIKSLINEYKIVYNLMPLNLNLVKINGVEIKKFDKTTFGVYVLMDLAIVDWEKEILYRKSKGKFYTEEELIKIIKELIFTFSELQKNNISHRDIKPQNILLFPNKKLRVADFGEAKTFMHNKVDTIKQTIRGTELYMSPILFHALQNKKKIPKYTEYNAFKSDVFSLGLCFLLASTLNFNALCDLREVSEMRIMKIIITKYLKNKYSNKFIEFLFLMLEIDEHNRLDFIELNNVINNN